ncbi:MAG: MFS transporter [Bacteroidales bacterium]|nr:MFS transporter [Bacteroidales bacterium]MDD3664339.1 MFS transporter [Bacteroidales bacterium]
MTNLKSVIRQFPRTFWIANVMELFERWAWYGMFMVLALYLTLPVDQGALGFSQSQKGQMMGTVTFMLYLLPIFTGALADRLGYRKVLALAYLILASGYFLMSRFESYWSVYMVFVLIAVGGSLFKPVISATIARTTNDRTSGLGFGIFYMIVNIGAFIGPLFASKLRGYDWDYVFYVSTFIIGLNLLMLFFYKEPATMRKSEPLFAEIKTILSNVFHVVVDLKFTLFLVIIAGFWSMYLQLFYSLPVFIEQWMDTSLIYNWISDFCPTLAQAVGTSDGFINPEMLTNMDAFFIVMFQVMVSGFVMRFKPLNTMMSGILIASLGIGLMFAFNNPFYLFASILIFGLGEMTTSPKVSEYIGRIAPEGKVALYMGCSYIPLALGNLAAGFLSGSLYQSMSDKMSLLQLELDSRGLQLPQVTADFTQTMYYDEAATALHLNQQQLSQYLWDTYLPGNIWIVFTGIGVVTFAALFLYDRLIVQKK